MSFDYEHDKEYYHLLKAWDANPDFDFTFSDCTPKEIQSDSISVVKQVLSTKFGEANYMIAIIGAHSNDKHPDSAKIGYKNWQAYEIAKNNEKGNGLDVVEMAKSYDAPHEAYEVDAERVNSFNQNDIVSALKRVTK